MAKKSFFVLVLALVLGRSFGAGDKHQPFDILLGLNTGFGITPNIGDVFSLVTDNVMP